MSDAPALSHGDKTLRGLRHVGSARIFSQLITWGLTAVTIHLLQPRDYGLIATAGIVTAFAQLLLDGGLGEVLISQRVLSEELQGAATTAVLIISIILAAIVFAVAPACSAFFHSPPLRAIIEVSAFYLPLSALQVAPGAYLYKHMQFGRVAVIQVVCSVLQGICTLGLAYIGEAYWALIIGVFIGAGLRTVLLWLSLDRKPMPNLRLRLLQPLVRNSGHMIGQRFTYFAIDNVDLFLLSRFSGAAVLGQYSVARSLSHTALNQIAGIVQQVTVPAFAAKADTQEQLRALLFVTSVASTVLFPLFWIMGVASQVALPLVFGARWGKLVVPFLAFTAILPLRGLYTLLNSSVIGTGRTGTTFKNTLTWAVIMMPLMALGVLKGADGVALSWTVGFPLVFYLGLRGITNAFATRVSTLLQPVLMPALCAGASALAADSLLWIGPHLLDRPAMVVCQCALGTLCYWLLLRTFGYAQYSQAIDIGRRLIRS